MLYLDLAELDQVFQGRWLWSAHRPNVAWFRRADYLGPHAVPLDRAVRDRVELLTGRRPQGPIRVLTHLRYLGYCFNPVTFYYCFDPGGDTVRTILAEITNTPWGERHCYALEAASSDSAVGGRFAKAFHVSPFMEAALEYDWRFVQPGARLTVHMCNLKDGMPLFDATLRLKRRPLSGGQLAAMLIAFPWMTAQVIVSIYWQALRLWLKRIPHHAHPGTGARAGTGASAGGVR